MVEVNCPSCRERMSVDEAEPVAEWECPDCSAVFVVEITADGTPRCLMVAPASSTAIQSDDAPRGRTSRRRRNRPTPDTHDAGNDMDISLPANPLLQRFPEM